MSKSEDRISIKDLTPRQLLLNVYISQTIFVLIAIIIAFLYQIPFPWINGDSISRTHLFIGFGTGVLFPFLSIELKKRLPSKYLDDGGINEKIFGSLSYSHILFLTGVIAFAEEWLFRGVIQSLLGLFLTSVIFSALHIRYINKPVLFSFVTILSFWLGFLYQWTDSIWIPFLAHFFIDFISGCWIANEYKRNMAESENGE